MSFGKQVGYSPLWALLYTPISDSLVTSFVSSGSLLGRALTYKINKIGAGFTAMGISFAADKIYDLIAKQEQLSSWLTYCENQDWKHDVVQLATRAITHVAIGAGLGLSMTVLVPSLGLTVASGIVLGGTAFIGPQLARLIYKVAIFVFNTGMKLFSKRSTDSTENSTVQELTPENTMDQVKKSNETESKIYCYMSLNKTSTTALEKNTFYENDSLRYKNAIKGWIKIDLMSLALNSTSFYQPNVDDATDEEFHSTIASLVEKMADKISEHREKNTVDNKFIQRLSSHVIYALAGRKLELLKKCEEKSENMNDPFCFQSPIKITKSDVDLINQIYEIVRNEISQKKERPKDKDVEQIYATTKNEPTLQNELGDSKQIKCEDFLPPLEKDLRSEFILHAFDYTDKTIKNPTDPYARAHVTGLIQQTFNENKLSHIQDFEIGEKYQITHGEKTILLTQNDLTCMNSKFGYARAMFGIFPDKLKQCQNIYTHIAEKFNLNPHDYNPQIIPVLCKLIVRVASLNEKEKVLKNFNHKSSTTIQLEKGAHQLTEKEITFINEIFQFAKKELQLD
jgi:hypothetical protein